MHTNHAAMVQLRIKKSYTAFLEITSVHYNQFQLSVFTLRCTYTLCLKNKQFNKNNNYHNYIFFVLNNRKTNEFRVWIKIRMF